MEGNFVSVPEKNPGVLIFLKHSKEHDFLQRPLEKASVTMHCSL